VKDDKVGLLLKGNGDSNWWGCQQQIAGFMGTCGSLTSSKVMVRVASLIKGQLSRYLRSVVSNAKVELNSCGLAC
jgi:hypothetical protein